MNGASATGRPNWREWPGLFLSAHGALSALNEAMAGLQVDPARMRANIDAQRGMVFGEAVSGYIGSFIGRPAAHAMLEELSRAAVAANRDLSAVASEAIEADERLRGKVDLAALASRCSTRSPPPRRPPPWRACSCWHCTDHLQRMTRHEPRPDRPRL